MQVLEVAPHISQFYPRGAFSVRGRTVTVFTFITSSVVLKFFSDFGVMAWQRGEGGRTHEFGSLHAVSVNSSSSWR